MATEESRVIFNKLDHHDERLRSLESNRELVNHRLEQNEKNYHQICSQLIKTETRLMDSITEIKSAQASLLAENNRRQGASDAIKWIWGSMGALLVALQIYQVFIK